MTKPTMALAELAEKGPNADLLREMIPSTSPSALMEMDMSRAAVARPSANAVPSARTVGGRLRDRAWDTRTGSVDLEKIPKLRSNSPAFLEPRRTAEGPCRGHSRKPTSRACPPARSTSW